MRLRSVTEMVSDGVTGPQTVVTRTTYHGSLPQSTTVSGYRPVVGGAPVPVSRTTTRRYYLPHEVEHVAGLLASIDGPREHVHDVTRFEYHDCAEGGRCGQLRRVVDAAGNVTRFDAYDAHGRVLRSTAPSGPRGASGAIFGKCVQSAAVSFTRLSYCSGVKSYCARTCPCTEPSTRAPRAL